MNDVGYEMFQISAKPSGENLTGIVRSVASSDRPIGVSKTLEVLIDQHFLAPFFIKLWVVDGCRYRRDTTIQKDWAMSSEPVFDLRLRAGQIA